MKIFWGDDEIEENSTAVDPNDDSKWDFVFEVNASGPVGLGSFLGTVDNLVQDTQYFFRGHAENLGGEKWAPNIESFLAMDTTFTKYTMEGMVLWLDAQDVDGDGYSDAGYADGVPMPIWIDKSLSEKHAKQSVAQKTPNYALNVFGGLPAIRFESGDAFNVGSLNVNYGNVHVFMVSKGSGVGIGATDGITGWSLDSKQVMHLALLKVKIIPCSISLGFDPRTGYGMLIGEIAEIMVFDRALPKSEQEMIEGYLAHKWGIVDDLAQTGFKLTRGLRLYYPFNETDGSVAQDYSVEMRHAEVIDADLNVQGKFGSAIDFESIDPFTARLALLQNELAINNGAWTVSSWFETPIQSTGVTFRHALAYGESGYIMLRNEFGGLTTKFLGLFDGTLEKLTPYDASTLSAGWHQIAVSSSVGQTRFFIDGTLVGQVSDNVILEIQTVGNLIGGNGKFSSKLDDFRVYDRTFSSAEVQTLYGNGNGDFGVHPYGEFPPSFDNIPVILPPRNPIVYWTFNELNGTGS